MSEKHETEDPWGELREHWSRSSERELHERESWAEPEMEEIHRLTVDLRNRGWRDASYCPKGGKIFLAWSPLMPFPYLCKYEGDWPNGRWWAMVDGDLRPDRPVLFRMMSEASDED